MNIEKLNKIIHETLSEIDLEERTVRGNKITPATHKIVGGGCRTCGVCHPNRCFSCDGGGYKCDRGGSKFVAKSAEDIKNERIKPKSAEFEPSMNENKINKNKMEKKVINERFQQLAGIKPLYENEEMESTKEMTKEDLLNEGPELWTVLGGLMGVIGAAGITSQLQMMAEDPAIAEKYPKLEKVFSMLAKIGGALGSGIKEEK